MQNGLKLAAIAILFVASSASAQETDIVVTSDYLRTNWTTVSGTVAYGDLNLATDAGVETLNSRVKAEAQRLCGLPERGDLKTKVDRDKCKQTVIASADPQIAKLAATARGK